MLMSKYKNILVLYVLLAAVYIFLILFTRPSNSLLTMFQLTSSQAKTLSLLLAIPFLSIWILALWAYSGMRSYADTIQRGNEGRAFDYLSRGLLVTVLFLPASNILSEITMNVQASHPSIFILILLGTSIITAVAILAAFAFTYLGSAQLLRFVQPPPQSDFLLTSILFVALVGLYIILIIHPAGTRPMTYSVLTFPTYGSSLLYDITVILPRVIGWFIGILAVLNFYKFRTKVHGVFYRAAFQNVANGNAVIILGAIVFRWAQDLLARGGSTDLRLSLLLNYLVLIVYGIGFALLGNGAQQLHKIEKVNGQEY